MYYVVKETFNHIAKQTASKAYGYLGISVIAAFFTNEMYNKMYPKEHEVEVKF